MKAVLVEPKHVALQSISEDNKGRLVFYVYIQLDQGILTLEVIRNALQVHYLNHSVRSTFFALIQNVCQLSQGNEQLYIDHVDGITAIVFPELSTSSTTSPRPTTSPSPTTSSSPTTTIVEDETPTVINVIIAVVMVVVMMIVAVVVCVAVMYVPL